MWKIFTREELKKLMEENKGSTDLVIPEGYDEIEQDVFWGSDLTSIVIASSVKRIGARAFQWCEKLEQVKFAEDSQLERIGEGAFDGTVLTSIEIPSTVKEICEEAFHRCQKLEQVKFAEGSQLEKIGEEAFEGTALTSIEIPSPVKEICARAFQMCEKLEQVKFAEDSQLERIGKEAFEGTALISIEIPSTVMKIDVASFYACKKLRQVKFAGKTVLNEIGTIAFCGTALISVEIPSTVQKICFGAFGCCSKLKEVKFIESSILERIGVEEFDNCDKLEEIKAEKDLEFKIIDGIYYYMRLIAMRSSDSIKGLSTKIFTGSNLKKVMFGKDATIEYDDDRKIRQLTIHIRNKNLAGLLISISHSLKKLVIKYDNYQQLDEFMQQLNVRCNSIPLLGKKLSIIEKYNIKRLINKTIGDNKTKIIFEESKVTQENKPTIVDGNIVLSKQNEGLLGRIKNLMFNPNSLPLLESVDTNLSVVPSDNQQLQAQDINFPDIMYFTSQITELCTYIIRESDKLVPSMKEIIINQLKDIFDHFVSEASYLGEDASISLYNRLEGLKLALDSQLSTTNEIQSESKSII